jgi:hypothetical protein
MKKQNHSARGYCWGPILPKILKSPHLRHDEVCFRCLTKGEQRRSSAEVANEKASAEHARDEGASQGHLLRRVKTSSAKRQREKKLKTCATTKGEKRQCCPCVICKPFEISYEVVPLPYK